MFITVKFKRQTGDRWSFLPCCSECVTLILRQENGEQDVANNSLDLWGSIAAIGTSVAISCSPDLFCFWLAARCNHQVQRNLIIPGPDLGTPDWIANMFDQCVKTVTLALIGHDLLGALNGIGWAIFTVRDYFPLAACGQQQGEFKGAVLSFSHFGYPICATGV